MGVGGQCHAPGRDLVPIVQEAKQAPGPVSLDGSGKSHPRLGFNPLTGWPIARHYNDYTILAHNNSYYRA